MSSQNFFTNVSFCYPFRDYQSRVLRQIEDLLDDQKLHIVAAPGSGKTVLGFEVIRRLNRKTLILVPTINLRNQWKERFFDLFLPHIYKKFFIKIQKNPLFQKTSQQQPKK